MTEQASTYNRTSQIFHWVSALLIISLAIFGTIMVRLGDGVALKTTMYRPHTFVSTLVLLLTIGRIIWLFVGKKPSPPEMPGWVKQAFTWNQQ